MYNMSNRNEGPLTPVSDKHVEDVSEIFFVLVAFCLFVIWMLVSVWRWWNDCGARRSRHRERSSISTHQINAGRSDFAGWSCITSKDKQVGKGIARLQLCFHGEAVPCARWVALGPKKMRWRWLTRYRRNITQINSKDVAFIHRRYA